VAGAGNASYIWNISSFGAGEHCLYQVNSTCTVSTANVAPGTYNISLLVADGTENRYATAPVYAQILITAAPTLSAYLASNVVTGGNVVYSVAVANGIGPFNVSIYTSNGQLVGKGIIQRPNETGLVFFKAPSKNTSYYAVAQDLGGGATYSFNSAASMVTVPTPAGSGANYLLIVIIVALVVVILIVYVYNSSRGARSDDYGRISINRYGDSEGDQGTAEGRGPESMQDETQSKLDPEEGQEGERAQTIKKAPKSGRKRASSA
jgi:hypothetical protein